MNTPTTASQTPNDRFSAWLKQRLDRLEISQEQLVQALATQGASVGRASVSRWMNGRSFPPREVFPRLLDALAVHGGQRDKACRLYANVPV